MNFSILTRVYWLSFFFILSSYAVQSKERHTFMLVHGSWHGDWAWYLLEEQLIKAGHDVIAVNLPGHGLQYNEASNVTLDDYSNAVITALDLLEEPVILVGHSLGGLVISAVAEQRPNKIECLIYLAAFLLKDNQSVLDISVQDTTSLIFPNTIIDNTKQLVYLNSENVVDLFYEDAPESAIILSEKLLTPEPLMPISTRLKLTDENYGSVPRYYIATDYDRAISPYIQEKMYTENPCEEVIHIKSGHSPFFSNVPQLKNILVNISKKLKGVVDGIVEAESKLVNFYPNPANHVVYVRLPPLWKIGKLSIFDPEGLLVYEDTLTDPINSLEISKILDNNTGLYLFKLESEKVSHTQKVLIKNR